LTADLGPTQQISTSLYSLQGNKEEAILCSSAVRGSATYSGPAAAGTPDCVVGALCWRARLPDCGDLAAVCALGPVTGTEVRLISWLDFAEVAGWIVDIT